jgi:hypothetical protein
MHANPPVLRSLYFHPRDPSLITIGSDQFFADLLTLLPEWMRSDFYKNPKRKMVLSLGGRHQSWRRQAVSITSSKIFVPGRIKLLG